MYKISVLPTISCRFEMQLVGSGGFYDFMMVTLLGLP